MRGKNRREEKETRHPLPSPPSFSYSPLASPSYRRVSCSHIPSSLHLPNRLLKPVRVYVCVCGRGGGGDKLGGGGGSWRVVKRLNPKIKIIFLGK